MNPERWRRLSELYHAACELDADRRAAYLRKASADDPTLRQEIESLLARGGAAPDFLAVPVLEVAAAALNAGSQAPMVGRQLGPYTIVSWLGAGGMGEVYQARDAKLGRHVAIKLMPRAFLSDDERLARFEREARMLAALNHPHIGAIYGFEQAGDLHGIVLELIEGPTLADVLAASPTGLPLDQGLTIASQIAEALDAAHEKGIIHRDLKPANIKITPKGEVKVLDFGLATIDSSDRSAPNLSQSPTITVGGTREGVILGTASYMSPEQARGKPLDKRTDLWSFGCVLYEMLTGTLAFRGETVSDTIAAILERQPEWNKLPAGTPPTVRRLLQRCLDKDAQHRLRDIGDARVEIDHALAEERHPNGPHRADATAAPVPAKPSRWLMAAGAFALLAVLGVLAFVSRRESLAPTVAEPIVQLTDFTDSALFPAISPDGRLVTFIRGGYFGASSAQGQIYVKILPTGEPVQLTRDESPKEQPVFSPDGSRIIYTSQQSGFKWDSWQVPVLGGAPKPFLPNASGLVWLDDQRMMYAEIMTGVHMGIVQSTESRSDHKIVYFPPLQGGMAHRAARSPDGRSVLVVEMDGGGWLPCRLMPFDGSSVGRPVGPQDGQCTTAAWSPDGRWMYFSSNAVGGFHIWRQRYPDGVPEQITSGPTEQEGTAITSDGSHLITSMGIQQGAVWLHGADGDRQLTTEGFAMLPTMARTGDRVFYLQRNNSARAYAAGELWSVNLATGEKERLLPGRIMTCYSISSDGKRVVFTSTGIEGGDGVWIADLDRHTPPRQLTRGGEYRAFFGSPGEIVYMNQGQVRHLYRMSEDGSGTRMIPSDPLNNLIAVSPDGHWAVGLMLEEANGGGTTVQFISMLGEKSFPACTGGCSLGFGPSRVQSSAFNWSVDGRYLFVALQYFGLRTKRTIALPYRSDVPLEKLYPRGLGSEGDVPLNPGARVINESDAFPTLDSSYLIWRRATQSNLYRVPLAN